MEPKTPTPAPARVASIDAFRGFIMLLILAEVLSFPEVVWHLKRSGEWAHAAGEVLRGAAGLPPGPAMPDHPVGPGWQLLGRHQSHVQWGGAVLHDLIQPGFSFLVGVALPFSLLARSSAGQTFGRKCLHALWRAVVLVLLGVFLSSAGKPQTEWVFTNTLSQIGLGYFFLFLLAHVRPRWQWAALAVILVGYWAAFALYEPDAHRTPAETGVKPGWPHHPEGFLAHWDKNTNAAAAFDRWFLNLFPRDKPFVYSWGGYCTLNFVPTLGTMILGLIAGRWVLRPAPHAGKFALLLGTGLGLLAAGYGLEAAGVCPVVKKIWTPTWVLFSGGWCFLFLAAFHALTDWVGYAGWAFPLRVVGANSILAYCMDGLCRGFFFGTARTHLGPDTLEAFGPEYEPLVAGAAVLAAYWLVLFWLYRRRIFIRI